MDPDEAVVPEETEPLILRAAWSVRLKILFQLQIVGFRQQNIPPFAGIIPLAGTGGKPKPRPGRGRRKIKTQTTKNREDEP